MSDSCRFHHACCHYLSKIIVIQHWLIDRINMARSFSCHFLTKPKCGPKADFSHIQLDLNTMPDWIDRSDSNHVSGVSSDPLWVCDSCDWHFLLELLCLQSRSWIHDWSFLSFAGSCGITAGEADRSTDGWDGLMLLIWEHVNFCQTWTLISQMRQTDSDRQTISEAAWLTHWKKHKESKHMSIQNSFVILVISVVSSWWLTGQSISHLSVWQSN